MIRQVRALPDTADDPVVELRPQLLRRMPQDVIELYSIEVCIV